MQTRFDRRQPRCFPKAMLAGLWLLPIACGRLSWAGDEVPSPEHVVLLVPGIVSPLADPAQSAAPAGEIPSPWRGCVEFLAGKGYQVGGLIRPTPVNIRLPGSLDSRVCGLADPAQANLFAVEFSPAANADGLAMRAAELAQAIEELHRYTGKRIHLVAYSAGGLVARCVLQEACPGIVRPAFVDRLITVSAPHLGAIVADNLGGLVDARAVSLATTAGLVRRLNARPLPANVCFVSLVLRAIGDDVRTPGDGYAKLMGERWQSGLANLPVDFQIGGDQLVHVRSQNLRLVPPAAEYELSSHRPIHTVLVRAPAKCLTEPGSLVAGLHGRAMSDPAVDQWVAHFLLDDGRLWTDRPTPARELLVRWQAESAAYGAIEAEVIRGAAGAVRQVISVTPLELEQIEATVPGECRKFRFRGTANWKSVGEWKTVVSGTMELTFDVFGRINRSRIVEIEEK